MKTLLRTLATVALTAVVAQGQGKAPNFNLEAADGSVVELSRLKGKVVVVNFWATWCGPCRSEIPGFLEVYKQYKSKGLEIVGVSLDRGGWDEVKPFVKKYKINYPVVVGDNDIVEAYGGIEAIPTTFFVDKKGNVVKRHLGYLDKSAFEKLIKGLL